MKKISTLALGLFAICAVYAQADILPVDETTGKVTYMEVVDAKGMNSTETFQVMKSWASKHHLEVVSKDGTKAEFKGKIKISYQNVRKNGVDDGIISFTAHLMAKEGRYRFIFTDFSHSSKTCQGGDIKPMTPPCAASKISKPGWYKVRKETNEKMKKYIESLKTAIKEAANDPAKRDDW